MIKERKINNNKLECLDERDQPERELKGGARGRPEKRNWEVEGCGLARRHV